MNIAKSFLLIFLLLIVIGCSSEKHNDNNDNDNQLTHINIEHPLDNRNNVRKSLSEFIDTVIYLPLETTSDCHIANIRNVILYEDNYYVTANSDLYKFSSTGKFICKIGNRGRGPTEYLGIGSVLIKNDTIFINGRDIFMYNTNGKFLAKYPYPYNIFDPFDIQKIGPDFVALNKNGFINFINKKGIVIDSINYERHTQELSNSSISYPLSFIFFGAENSIKISTSHNDTLFEIDTRHKLIPRYILDMGKYKMPDKYRFRYQKDDRELFSVNGKYLRPVPLETKNYLLIQFRDWVVTEISQFGLNGNREIVDTEGLGIYDKRNDTFSIIDTDWEHYPCFYPYFSDGEHTLISFRDAYEVIDFYNKNKADSNLYKPFISMVNSITINDNPVLILVKLKG